MLNEIWEFVCGIKPEWILVIATIIYVFFTYKLTRETQRLREIETSPFISVYLQSFKRSQYMEVVIENIGKAPAYDLKIKFDEDLVKELHLRSEDFPEQLSINYLASGQSLNYFLDNYTNLPKGDDKYITFEISYKSKENKEFSETINYNYSFFMKSNISVPYEIEQQKQMLDKLGKSIDNTVNKAVKTLKETNKEQQ